MIFRVLENKSICFLFLREEEFFNCRWVGCWSQVFNGDWGLVIFKIESRQLFQTVQVEVDEFFEVVFNLLVIYLLLSSLEEGRYLRQRQCSQVYCFWCVFFDFFCYYICIRYFVFYIFGYIKLFRGQLVVNYWCKYLLFGMKGFFSLLILRAE